METAISPDLIRTALQHIPANLSRDSWVRMGMAVKSEFPDETGRSLFTEWSASTPHDFDPRATRSTWCSIKQDGGVGIGTLLHLAKEHGFTLPMADQAPSPPDPVAAAKLAAERANLARLESEQTAARHAATSDEAKTIWDAASEAGHSGYLTRKGVKPYGVRITSDGVLLVPMRDTTGKLWNVQRIAPEPPSGGGPDKLFQRGGRKSGLWHMIGDSTRASVLLVAEGYATAASVHEATNRPTACAFDAGNLAQVTHALHQAHPTALIMICGDDDTGTQERTGHNPGRDKATESFTSSLETRINARLQDLNGRQYPQQYPQ